MKLKIGFLLLNLMLAIVSLHAEDSIPLNDIHWTKFKDTGDAGFDSIVHRLEFLFNQRGESVLTKEEIWSADSSNKKLPVIPANLQNSSLAIEGENAYIVGDGISGNFFVCKTNDRQLSWKRLPDFPAGYIYTHLVVQSNGEYPSIYALASSADSTLSRIFIYDTRKSKWIAADSGHLVLSFISVTGTSIGSTYILLCQYEKKSRANDSLYLLNTITKQVSFLQSLPDTPAVKRKLYMYQNKLILISFNESGQTRVWTGAVRENNFFSSWDYIVLFGYLLLIALIGLRFSGRQRTTADYFKADGQMPAWAVGISILGANLSAITFMSAPANTYGSNWFYFFPTIAVVLVIPVVNKYFIPFYRRLGITSAYEYLDKRFNYLVRFSASLLYILSHIGRISIVLVLPSIALTIVTGISVNVCVLLMGLITLAYTFKGGIKAVIWTDVLQVFLMFGGALLCLFLIIHRLPMNAHEIWQHLRKSGKLSLMDDQLNLVTPNFLVVLLGGWTFNFLAFSTDQTTVQRYLTTRDELSAKKSAAIGAWSAVPAGLLFMVIGSFLYLFYYTYPDRVNITQQSHDAIFPWYIVSELPAGVRGLLIAAIFAAAMSSLSAGLNSVSTALITDFYKKNFAKRLTVSTCKLQNIQRLSWV